MNRTHKKSFWALMVTQFFGAFNDNVLKVLVTVKIIEWVHNVNMQEQLVALSGAVFVAPFLIFSMIAGRIADRAGKPKVMVATKYWELFVVTAAVLSLWAHSLPAMLFALFMLSMQAAFFSPSKYGILPELMGEEDISRANGWLNIGTFTAILIGTVVGGFLSTTPVGAGATMLAASLAGLVASFSIEPLPPAKPQEPLLWNPMRDLAANWKLITRDRLLQLGTIAVNYFWFLGAVLQLNIFLYASEMMHTSPKSSGMLLIPVILGIGIGSFLAGAFSGKHIELGLVPWGLLGMSLFSLDLGWAHHSMTRLVFDLFMVGFSAGFYEIPLTALVQWRSPSGERGRILATVNFFSFVAILGASGVLWILNTFFDLNPAQVFGVLGSASLLGTLIFLIRFPEVRKRSRAIFRRGIPA